MSLIKILNDVISTDRIESVQFLSNPSITVSRATVIKLIDIKEDFYFTDDIADLAEKMLVPNVVLRLDNDVILSRNIEWASLQSPGDGVNVGQNVVEIRVSTDPVDEAGNQLTRKYSGDLASAAYDQIVELTGTSDEEIANQIMASKA